MHASNSFKTSFLTTSFIIGFNILYGCTTCLNYSSSFIMCVQWVELMPFRSLTLQSSIFLLAFSTLNNFPPSIFVNELLMIAGCNGFSPNKTYFKCFGSSFNSGSFFTFERLDFPVSLNS